MKAEILSSLKENITTLLRSELNGVKEEVISSVVVLCADLDSVKQTAGMEHSLSTCSGDITTLQTTVHKLSKDVAGLQEKCVDLEGVACTRSAFNEVKNILRGQKGTRFGMFYPARLRITHNGTKKEFQDPAEAMAYVRANMTQTG
ncbi:hypothetical protein SRHO_G00182010 [Serrasalmus rhombeus]